MEVDVLSRGHGGIVEGVVRSVDGFRPGDIVYVGGLDLGRMYGIIPVAKLVFVESGGFLSHPAILGREYCVPVLRFSRARELVGRWVRVDLDRGTLEVLDQGEAGEDEEQ